MANEREVQRIGLSSALESAFRGEQEKTLIKVRNRHNMALQGLGRRLAAGFNIEVNASSRFFVGLRRSEEDPRTLTEPSKGERWIAVLRIEDRTQEGLTLINPYGVRLGQLTLSTQQATDNESYSPNIRFARQASLSSTETDLVTSLAEDVLQLSRDIDLLDPYTLRLRQPLQLL